MKLELPFSFMAHKKVSFIPEHRRRQEVLKMLQAPVDAGASGEGK